MKRAERIYAQVQLVRLPALDFKTEVRSSDSVAVELSGSQ